MSANLKPETIIGVLPKLRRARCLLDTLGRELGHEPWPSLTSLVALRIIEDLYDPASPDEINLQRISFSLETAADELQVIRRRITELARKP